MPRVLRAEEARELLFGRTRIIGHLAAEEVDLLPGCKQGEGVLCKDGGDTSATHASLSGFICGLMVYRGGQRRHKKIRKKKR